jgi:peptidoglycan DL-endopeptidase CwlO
MRPRYAAIALLLGAFCAGVVVACGGDDDAPITPTVVTTGPSDQAASKSDFIDEADAVCEEANAAIASLDQTSAGDASTQVSEEKDIVDGVIDQIDSLGAPSEDEATLDDFIDALEELSDMLDKQQLAAERNDTAALSELETEATAVRADVATVAEEYGFKQCGQEGEAPTATGTGDTGAGTVPGGEAAPVEPAPAPAAPATPTVPAPTPAPAPAPPSSGGTGGDTGGTAPGGGSGGVSP